MVAPLALVLVGAACSGPSTDDSSSTAPTDAATAPASDGVVSRDVESIVAAYEARSHAWLEGAASALEKAAAFAYPPGEWTADSVSLPCRRSSRGGDPAMTVEEWVRGLDEAGYRMTLTVDEASIVADPDWTIPPGRPGGGTHPDGRAYAVEVTTRSTAPETDGTTTEHVTALNGTVYWFPGDC